MKSPDQTGFPDKPRKILENNKKENWKKLPKEQLAS